ncbi:hypothetical protein PIB30_012903 [Stylosanthes scabra]|uniref:O-methyltransferase dimerisation domain-containing protein n=1 Tax=Stylosanthes scabra TaxID=79078 RepID=A0ABU6X6Y2_9FABA|nr:hypothetical protein [Stylosanthes scabra]
MIDYCLPQQSIADGLGKTFHSMLLMQLPDHQGVNLGIFDAVHNYGKPMPLPQLITSLQIHPSKAFLIQRLMRILINSGFFTTKNINNDDYEVEYFLTDSSMLLLKNNPLSMTPFVLLSLDPV